jgi:hypothetical protein
MTNDERFEKALDLIAIEISRAVDDQHAAGRFIEKFPSEWMAIETRRTARIAREQLVTETYLLILN